MALPKPVNPSQFEIVLSSSEFSIGTLVTPVIGVQYDIPAASATNLLLIQSKFIKTDEHSRQMR